jgi:DNA repair exonuclease SbcCD nuclease subunit
VTAHYAYKSEDVIEFKEKPKMVFLGHIHTPFDGVMDGVPIIIPGSICPSNWADVADQRHIYLIEGKVKAIPINHVITRVISNESEIVDNDRYIYRLLTTEEEVNGASKDPRIKSIVIEKPKKFNHKSMNVQELIRSYCSQFSANYAEVTKLLEGVGFHVGAN